MKVNESVRIEREKIIKVRQEDIRRRKAERERKEREEKIRIEREKEEKEREEKIRIEKEKERKERKERRERIKREKEEKERIKLRREMTFLVGIFVFFAIVIALNFDEFVVYLKIIGIVVGLTIVSLFVSCMNSLPNYTKPHRYIVQDEINKNYEVKEDWGTTTYVPKNKR